MVHRTYYGLGNAEAAVRVFDSLEPYARQLLGLQAECPRLGPDYLAIDIALDALQTAAYHFTRRRYFYREVEVAPADGPGTNGRLADRAEAVAAFRALSPYHDRLRALQGACRPFGRDYLALEIARQGLESAAFHFTRVAGFYGLTGDGGGGTRPVF